MIKLFYLFQIAHEQTFKDVLFIQEKSCIVKALV